MTSGSGKAARQRDTTDRRGGYASSSKQVSKLAPPPRGPAPGATKSSNSSTGAK